jgi:hypothetical protein
MDRLNIIPCISDPMHQRFNGYHIQRASLHKDKIWCKECSAAWNNEQSRKLSLHRFIASLYKSTVDDSTINSKEQFWNASTDNQGRIQRLSLGGKLDDEAPIRRREAGKKPKMSRGQGAGREILLPNGGGV